MLGPIPGSESPWDDGELCRCVGCLHPSGYHRGWCYAAYHNWKWFWIWGTQLPKPGPAASLGCKARCLACHFSIQTDSPKKRTPTGKCREHREHGTLNGVWFPHVCLPEPLTSSICFFFAISLACDFNLCFFLHRELPRRGLVLEITQNSISKRTDELLGMYSCLKLPLKWWDQVHWSFSSGV